MRMRKTIAYGIAALMTLLACATFLPTAQADLIVIDTCDIGDTSAETGHNLIGWGPALAPSGGWGGAYLGILGTDDKDLRVTWGPSEGEGGQSASLTLSTGDYVGTTLKIVALDGQADDSFDVHIDGELIYSHSGDMGSEDWYEHGIPVHVDPYTTVTVTITATAEAWPLQHIYGQLAISYVTLLGFEDGYDEYGYNYQAHMFNGIYSDADRVHGGPYGDVHLMMKWSDAWLSNQDRNGDGELDRGVGPDYDSSSVEGAWITNHMRGVDDNGKKWTWFVKIVYPPGGAVDLNDDDIDDNTGAPVIWTDFIVIKDVFSGSGSINYVNPQGFGAWQ
jgi:hypothetical protein